MMVKETQHNITDGSLGRVHKLFILLPTLTQGISVGLCLWLLSLRWC